MDVQEHLRPDALVIDVCSLKMLPCQWMLELLPQTVGIVGTHPLFGPQSAPDAIAGQRIAVCPVRGDHAKVARFLAQLGLEVIECSPEEHDRQMAVSQALTHFIGRAMLAGDFEPVQLSTLTYDRLCDIARIIGGNSNELFEDMQQLNPFAAAARRKFLEVASKLDAVL